MASSVERGYYIPENASKQIASLNFPIPEVVMTESVLVQTVAPVAHRVTFSQQIDEQTPYRRIISPQEYRERTGFVPSIPLASVLHDEYVRRRDVEIAEGRYVPGELLSVRFDQPSLRQLFIDQGRKNILHEVKNAHGKIVEKGTPIDWYNPTQPFYDRGDRIMAVRFEPRDSESSFVGFIKQNPQNGEYTFDPERPIIDMAQDPSITFDNNGNPVLGVVKIHPDKDAKRIRFKTVQFRGPDVGNMKVFQTLPGKDNRPVQLPDRVRGWYRPQGEVGGSGKLAFRDYSNWDEYKKDAQSLTKADLLTTNFHDSNHGGPNFPLADGQIYGHIAEKEYNKNGDVVRLHYYAIWALTDPKTGQVLHQENPETGELTPLIRIIVDRDDFPQDLELIPDKDPENPQFRQDVIFVAGIEMLPNGMVEITNGISDTRSGKKSIDNQMRNVDKSHLVLVA